MSILFIQFIQCYQISNEICLIRFNFQWRDLLAKIEILILILFVSLTICLGRQLFLLNGQQSPLQQISHIFTNVGVIAETGNHFYEKLLMIIIIMQTFFFFLLFPNILHRFLGNKKFAFFLSFSLICFAFLSSGGLPHAYSLSQWHLLLFCFCGVLLFFWFNEWLLISVNLMSFRFIQFHSFSSTKCIVLPHCKWRMKMESKL